MDGARPAIALAGYFHARSIQLLSFLKDAAQIHPGGSNGDLGTADVQGTHLETRTPKIFASVALDMSICMSARCCPTRNNLTIEESLPSELSLSRRAVTPYTHHEHECHPRDKMRFIFLASRESHLRRRTQKSWC